MAEQYKSFIDQFLEEYTPDYEEVGLGAAEKSGEEQLDRTHKYVDEDFLEGLSDDTNVHTQGPRGGRGVRKGAGMHGQHRNTDEIAEAFPRVRASNIINRTAAALGDESVFEDAIMSIEEARNHGFNEKRVVKDAEVERYIKSLLNGGMPPVKVAVQLEKMAELMLFNRQTATDYLNRNAGVLGMAYIQPNEYMNDCPSTYQRLKVKGAGKIAAKSVKQINACEGCMFFKKNASGKTCNLYHLPVIGTQNELLTVVNKMTAGVPAKDKKAALVKQANVERSPLVQIHNVSRPAQKVAATTAQATRERTKTAEQQFSGAEVEKLHAAGNSLPKIYSYASRKVGSAKATKAVREFIASLKTKNTKVALSQIDCTFLKGKLGMQNAIVGAAKCASCTFRQGMHCGLTGGTLISFPGMDKQAPNHKVAAGAPKDGKAMLQEFDMTTAAAMEDIEISEPKRAAVEIGLTMAMGDIE
jgi:hypothetical protein